MRSRLAATALGAACVLSLACGQKPASIQVSPTKVRLYGIDRTQLVTARVLDKKGQPVEGAQSLSWSSSKRDVVEVDSKGRLTAKGAGKASVSAALDNLKAMVSVEVVDVKSVDIVPLSARLVGPPGSTLPLAGTVKNSQDQKVSEPVAWSSSDERVATVSPDGVVTSAGAGKATIAAKVGDVQAAAEIFVDPRPISRLVLAPATALVRVGDSQHYTVSVFGPDGKEIEGATARYTSSNPAVAPVDPAGVASGVKAGVATIRAQVGDKSAEATVIVN
ncbi:MAG TPA: Ig-like domain-containing protein [Thermoanaerobaculia bacterium]|jgi:uncharacterized protein YjdB